MAPEELAGSADYDYPQVTNVTGNEEVSSEWEVFFTTVFIPVLYSFIFLLGLAGNLFVIVLMAKKSGGKRMVDTFVLNLAVADVIFICTLPFWVVAGARGNRWPLGEGLCKVSSYAIAVNRCSSILFLTALSVERYLVIRKALDTKTVGSRRHVRITCGIIWTVSLLLGAPSLVYRRLDGDDCWDEDGEDFSLAMVFLTFLLPLGVISFCYCSIYCRLQRHVRLGRGVRRSHRAIVTIVTAFLCSWLPLNACKVLLFFLAKGTLVLSQGQEVALRWVVAGSTCLAFVNSCVNPLVYALMDGRCRPRCPFAPCAPGSGPATAAPSSATDSSLLFGGWIWTKPPGPRRRSGTELQSAPGVPRGPHGSKHVPVSRRSRAGNGGERPGSQPGMGEVSDTDSGIMLHSGPDSPVSPLKERAQAGRRQQQALEARLEGCVQELRRLCLREAELTGTLPREYPLKAGEKPPKVRRRIGAAFKLDETLVLRGADPLSALERDLALQLQIAKAARRLCREENISKRLRKRRQTAALLEEQKLKDLENVLNQRRLLAGRRPLSAGAATGAAEELSTSDESSLSDAVLLEEEETQLPGPAAPRGSPSPEEPTEAEGSGPPPPPSPWRETSLDRPYEKAKKPGVDPGDGETRGSRCYPGSPPATPAVPSAAGSPEPAASPVPRAGDVPPYRFVPIRTRVLCRQAGSSAPSTPEPSGRRGQTQSLRVEACWQPGEPRGRSAVPRRRPTYYTVTVPTSCIPTPGPAHRSGSDDSISDLSSVSHATSPGSSSPDVSFPRPPVPPPLADPGYYPRGAHRFLPPAAPPAFLYEQDLAPLRYQRLVPSHSRIVRTPSLKDYAPAGGRGLSKAAVTEELKSWHQRARLRGVRPHSLDRQGAFRGPRGGTTRDVPITRGVLPWAQASPVHVLRRSPDGVPVQVYMPENGEIVTQV